MRQNFPFASLALWCTHSKRDEGSQYIAGLFRFTTKVLQLSLEMDWIGGDAGLFKLGVFRLGDLNGLKRRLIAPHPTDSARQHAPHPHLDDTVHSLGEREVVSRNQRRDAFIARQIQQLAEHDLRGLRIEVARRFVG